MSPQESPRLTCPVDWLHILFAGMGQKIVDNFGEAKLLDDIIDHWDAGASATVLGT